MCFYMHIRQSNENTPSDSISYKLWIKRLYKENDKKFRGKKYLWTIQAKNNSTVEDLSLHKEQIDEVIFMMEAYVQK